MLFPKSSAHRMLFQLDGLWNFSIKSDSEDDLMVMEEVRAMPVPLIGLSVNTFGTSRISVRLRIRCV